MWLVALGLLTLFGTIYFAMAETSLVSLSKITIKNMLENNVKRAKEVEKLISNKEKLISSLLVMTNFTAIVFTTVSTALALQIVGEGSEGFAMVVSTSFSTVILIVIGDIIPKVLAAKYSQKVACAVAKPVTVVLFLLSPISNTLNGGINKFLSFLGATQSSSENTITEDEIITMLNVGYEEGVIPEEQSQMIDNVLDFRQAKAYEIMIPRIDIISIPHDASYEEIKNTFKKEKYTRLPVHKQDLDHIIGTIHFKDFAFINKKQDFSMQKHMREPIFSYENQSTQSLLSKMRQKNCSIAIVLDEYGGTAGLVTMEDIVEYIVGEIFDEYDDIGSDIILKFENEYEKQYSIKGYTKIDDFNKYTGASLFSEDYDTLAGYVIGLFGYIPKQEEKIYDNDITFIIEKSEKNRIEALRAIFKISKIDIDKNSKSHELIQGENNE